MATQAEVESLFAHNLKDDSWSFTGDLDKAREFLASEGVLWWEGIIPRTGNYWVELDMGHVPTEPGSGNTFGTGETPDIAWRYAIAAEILSAEYPESMDEALEMLEGIDLSLLVSGK